MHDFSKCMNKKQIISSYISYFVYIHNLEEYLTFQNTCSLRSRNFASDVPCELVDILVQKWTGGDLSLIRGAATRIECQLRDEIHSPLRKSEDKRYRL